MMLRAPLGWLNTPFYVKRISFVRASQLSLAAQDFFVKKKLNSSLGLSLRLLLREVRVPTELIGVCAYTIQTTSNEEVQCASLGGGLCQSRGLPHNVNSMHM